MNVRGFSSARGGNACRAAGADSHRRKCRRREHDASQWLGVHLEPSEKVDMKSATTAWTAQLKGNTLPFGWAVIEFAPEEDNAALRSWCGQFNRGVRSPESLVAELASRREAISAVLRKEQEERRRSDELAQRAREEQESVLRNSRHFRKTSAWCIKLLI